MPFSLFKRYHSIKRYREILFVLIKYGFEDVVERLHIGIVVSKISGVRMKKLLSLSPAERLRLAIEELGPTFIKFGQILSMRSDILPDEYIKELEKLQDELPPFSAGEAVKIIEEELDHTLAAVFEEFDPIPVAAGSIAQVHRAKLRSGEAVAVKVQRPNIRKVIDQDLTILRELMALVTQYIPA